MSLKFITTSGGGKGLCIALLNRQQIGWVPHVTELPHVKYACTTQNCS